MPVNRYKKLQVVVSAIEWLGDDKVNHEETMKFCEGNARLKGDFLIIDTLEGGMQASWGDFIVKGIEGEFYPVKPSIFWKTYRELGDACEEGVVYLDAESYDALMADLDVPPQELPGLKRLFEADVFSDETTQGS